MSEPTDELQARSAGEELPQVEGAPDSDDVEVLAPGVEVLAPGVDLPETRQHDSFLPTSRRLAPPPKPKRDSQPSKAGSVPPAGGVVSAFSAGASLRAIGEALAEDPGAFSTMETPTGGRPAVPRPRSGSQPALRTPSEPPSATLAARAAEPVRASSEPAPGRGGVTSASEHAPASTGVLARRIVSVGKSVPPPPVAPVAPDAAAAPVAAHAAASPASSLSTALASAETFALPPSVPLDEVPPPPPVAEISEATVPAAMSASFPARDERAELMPDEPPDVALPDSGFVPPPPPRVAVDPAPHAWPEDAAPSESREVSLETPHVPRAPRLESDTALDVEEEDDDEDAGIPILMDEDDRPTPLPIMIEAVRQKVGSVPPPGVPSSASPDGPALPAAAAEALGDEELAPDSADRLALEELPGEVTPVHTPQPSQRTENRQPPPPPRRAPSPPSAQGEALQKKKPKQKRPWWEELFSEDFVRASWKVSEEQIKREVTFVEESLGVAAGGIVLDLGCGSGQHAVELASRGYAVVGYDLSLYQLALAADVAQERSQKINFLQGDMREMAFEEMFDGIFCWNTSFGYFEEDKNFSVAERVFRALRPGGMFLIDVMNRDFVAANTPSSVWFEGDACVCMDDAVIDYFTSRLRVKRSVILDDGRTRECTYSVRLYSFHELGKLLHEVGFRVTEVSGHPATPGVFLGQSSPRILMLAQRP
jgi:SAM-dependent methyltransferase